MDSVGTGVSSAAALRPPDYRLVITENYSYETILCFNSLSVLQRRKTDEKERERNQKSRELCKLFII